MCDSEFSNKPAKKPKTGSSIRISPKQMVKNSSPVKFTAKSLNEFQGTINFDSNAQIIDLTDSSEKQRLNSSTTMQRFFTTYTPKRDKPSSSSPLMTMLNHDNDEKQRNVIQLYSRSSSSSSSSNSPLETTMTTISSADFSRFEPSSDTTNQSHSRIMAGNFLNTSDLEDYFEIKN